MKKSLIETEKNLFKDFSLGERKFLENIYENNYKNYPDKNLWYSFCSQKIKITNNKTFFELIKKIYTSSLEKIKGNTKKLKKEKLANYTLFDLRKERDDFNKCHSDLIGIFEKDFADSEKDIENLELIEYNSNSIYFFKKFSYYEFAEENYAYKDYINNKKYFEKFFGIFYEDLDKVFLVCSRNLFFNYELDYYKGDGFLDNKITQNIGSNYYTLQEFLSLSKSFWNQQEFDKNKEYNYFLLKSTNYEIYKKKYVEISQKLEELREMLHEDIFSDKIEIDDSIFEENVTKKRKKQTDINKDELFILLEAIYFVDTKDKEKTRELESFKEKQIGSIYEKIINEIINIFKKYEHIEEITKEELIGDNFKNYLKSKLDTTKVVHYLDDSKIREIF